MRIRDLVSNLFGHRHPTAGAAEVTSAPVVIAAERTNDPTLGPLYVVYRGRIGSERRTWERLDSFFTFWAVRAVHPSAYLLPTGSPRMEGLRRREEG